MLSGTHPAAVSGLRPFIPDKKKRKLEISRKIYCFSIKFYIFAETNLIFAL